MKLLRFIIASVLYFGILFLIASCEKNDEEPPMLFQFELNSHNLSIPLDGFKSDLNNPKTN
ncbi:MAG: hypothetical protein P8X57_14895 [Cyclobacteriaceae bacterium]